MDALYEHGGKKIYEDKNETGSFKFSEHSGLLDFNDFGLEKIVVSGKTTRVDKNDDEIYLPKNMADAIDYEYIFHTHPATPKPGGRVSIGILYEFPSISDIFHFLDHFNLGITQGSIVITPEGLYNIRKNKFDMKKIKINEDKLFKEMVELYDDVQTDAVDRYGSNFNTYDFYSKIAQDTSFIERINNSLKKYNLHIDYYPRKKNKKGQWIIDTIYFPIHIVEPMK